MIYRVDYVIGVMLAGVAAGAIFSRKTSRIEPARLARAYFVIVAVLLGLRVVDFVCSVVLADAALWNKIANGMGDASNFLLGALFGVAALRKERREILCDPAVYSALCLVAGVGFVITGYVKAFYLQGMGDFFVQSGYSTTFLKFIMTAEVLGGLGLVIPWTVLPAIAGLSVDMFGAIYTHIHNGDPLNDSTGAIATLIRLGVIALLWAWRPRQNAANDSARRRILGVAMAAVCCAIAAVTGSEIVRHAVRQSPQASPHAMTSPDVGRRAHEQAFGAENQSSRMRLDAPLGYKI